MVKKRNISKDRVHEYWKERRTGCNSPEFYLAGEAKSQLVRNIIMRYAKPVDSILEIGCNVGRNLYALYTLGYETLFGIEINNAALELLSVSYPGLGMVGTFYAKPVEGIIKNFKDSQFDVVFTLATLEHIHTESEWVFEHIARVTNKYLVTIEDESHKGVRHFPRNYFNVFTGYGMEQVYVSENLQEYGLTGRFILRVFQHKGA